GLFAGGTSARGCDAHLSRGAAAGLHRACRSEAWKKSQRARGGSLLCLAKGPKRRKIHRDRRTLSRWFSMGLLSVRLARSFLTRCDRSMGRLSVTERFIRL